MGTQLVLEQIDASTLQRCRENDPAAQRRVFEHYKDQVYSIAVEFLKGDESAAKDVTQEVFVKVFRGLPSFRQEARFSTWLYRIVTNACMDEVRRGRRLVFYADLPRHMHPTTEPTESSDADGPVRQALARLSPKLRIVVLLRYFEDLSYEEIADATGVSAGTVASRLNRAHRSLGNALRNLRTSRVVVPPVPAVRGKGQ